MTCSQICLIFSFNPLKFRLSCRTWTGWLIGMECGCCTYRGHSVQSGAAMSLHYYSLALLNDAPETEWLKKVIAVRLKLCTVLDTNCMETYWSSRSLFILSRIHIYRILYRTNWLTETIQWIKSTGKLKTSIQILTFNVLGAYQCQFIQCTLITSIQRPSSLQYMENVILPNFQFY